MKTMLICSLIGFSVVFAGTPKPNAPTDAERARWTMADMRSLATSVEAYAVDNKDLYPAAATLDALIPMIEPVYIRTAPAVDAWGHPYVFVPSADRRSYRIISGGSDGATDPKSWEKAGELTTFAEDAVVDSGSFSRAWPLR
jgi:hypothetical protein